MLHKLSLSFAVLALSLVTAACSGASSDSGSGKSGAGSNTDKDGGAGNGGGGCSSGAKSCPVSDDGGAGSSGGDTGGGGVSTEGTIVITPGTAVMLNSTTNGNGQRDYSFVVPSGTNGIKIALTGGSCESTCAGDDVQLYLKLGAIPDAFSPDGMTTKFTHTPEHTSSHVHQPATAGTWFLSVTDDANTLGYKGVSMTVSLQ